MKAKLKFAMVQDIVVAYQLIARHAAQGKDLDAYLRMMADEADEGRTRAPARGRGGAGAGGRFLETEPGAPVAVLGGGAIMTHDGKVYE